MAITRSIFTSSGAGRRLKVSHNTIKTWSRKIGVGAKDSANRLLLDERDIEKLAAYQRSKNG